MASRKRRTRISKFIEDLRDAGVREVTLVLEEGQAKRRRIGFTADGEGEFLDLEERRDQFTGRRDS